MKLNLGSGETSHADFTNVDIKDYGNNIVADVLTGLSFPDDHFDFVLMNHVLQTFTYNKHQDVLKEVKRMMKPKAVLRIITPDIALAIHALVKKDNTYFPVDDSIESTLGGKFCRYLYWHGETRSGFMPDALADLLKRNGFKNIELGKFGDCELDSRESESFIMVCQK